MVKAATKQPRRKPGRPLATADVDTRKALLNAAHDLLLESKGLPVPISAICEKARVNPAMVNYYFGGKRDLTVSLFEQLCESWNPDLESLLLLDVPPSKKLEIHIRQMIRNYQNTPYASRLMTEVIMTTKPAVAKRLGNNFVRPLISFYERLIEQGVAAGEFRPVEPMFLFFSVVGQCEYMFASLPLLSSALGITKLDEEFQESFIKHTTQLVFYGVASGNNASSESPAKPARKATAKTTKAAAKIQE
ncbi:TetR family transcriptional regulator C-terminal domain-containing protein [Ottowia thiooxydans]|uniref:TetR family transcriptional regulator C-terminal domain-containing protein n=1 Tax=Ottowia thiooxydans TaxID=219182 RepID=UPI0003F61CA7|nr:TetR family transcriptional regulator C-terminal domain-containing protein [Ottowia thiooxydans]